MHSRTRLFQYADQTSQIFIGLIHYPLRHWPRRYWSLTPLRASVFESENRIF